MTLILAYSTGSMGKELAKELSKEEKEFFKKLKMEFAFDTLGQSPKKHFVLQPKNCQKYFDSDELFQLAK